MANDLTPAEKEDRETGRLINRKPAPSRKHREKRAPRHHQRRRRIREDDPDLRKPRSSSYDQDEDSSNARFKDHVLRDDADLDQYLRDIEAYLGDDDDDFDFDSVIDSLSDVADVPPHVVEKVVEHDDPDELADLLKANDYDMSKLEDLDRQLGLSATSNKSSGPMSPRTGAYHGVRDVRGNPTDPPNTGSLPDRRYFTDKDYDVIVKFAGKLLDEDWLKYGWDGGAEDAPVRAALDLAIQTANGNAYQSKIDPETYDLLLNRLAKWGYDTFSDTVLPMKAPAGDNRRASAMKNTESYKQIVRVASELRDTHPAASLEILKSLRSLVSTEAEPAQSISELAVEGDPKAAVATVAADAATEAAVKVIVSAEIEAGEAAEIPLPVLLKVAASSAGAKAALGPFILAAAKKKQSKGKKKGKIPPQFLKNVKKKGDAPPKKDKKASIAAEDASW